MANPVPNMLPSWQKDPTRRTFLSAMAVPLMVPHIKDAASAFAGSNHPNLSPNVLPFVNDANEDERLAGASPRCFWSVSPCGHYGHDCATGAEYAAYALDYMVVARSPHILQWSVFDMMAMDRGYSGIEVGFLSVFGRIATNAHARALQMKGGAA